MFLNSHDVSISEILAIHSNQAVRDSDEQPHLTKIQPYGYCVKEYRSLSERLGSYGYSRLLS